jgi:uncharacterized SAM-binding protein YcdF (DUF218 family)
MALLILAGWLFYKKERFIPIVLLAITGLFFICSNFYCSDLLLHSLEYHFRPPKNVQGDVVVFLGGGATLDSPNLHYTGHLSGAAANRLLTCIQLYHQLKRPLIVSGGKVFENTGREADIAKASLIEAGIPGEKILVENQSLNTTENAKYTAVILGKYHYRHPILVTSAFHMWRAIRQFHKFGIEATPYPTDYRTNQKIMFNGMSLVPQSDALNNFSIAIKEYYGILMMKWY